MSLFRSRARYRFAVAAAGISLALAPAALTPAAFAGEHAEPQRASESATVPDADHAQTEPEARRIAAQRGHNVVVDDLSGPTLLIRARADGQMEAVSSQVPEQALVGGRWKPVDSTLVEGASWWEPKVAAVPVRVGKGGSADIVAVRSESGDWVTETWPYGDLPKPSVSKDTAVFHEVLPAVDLRVKATKAGMREVLVVKTPEAAADERVADMRLGLRGASMRVQPETGTLEAHTGSGEPVVAATPLWWDSSDSRADADSPGGDEPQAVTTTIQGAESVMDVGEIAEGDVSYPLYVDPDWSGYLQYDWFTDRAYPNQSYLNPPENSVGYGIENGVGYLSRAFYRFDTAFLAGKSVSNARFNVVQNWANSCASTWTQLWQYGPSAVGFTWNSDPAQWVRAIDAQGYNTGGPCSPNPAWVGFSATPTAQDAALYSAPYITLALRTADEGNSLSRKHFRWDAQLIVTYNSRPNVPTGVSMISPNRGCSTDANNPSYVYGGQDLVLQVAATDPDPGNVAADFFLKTVATGAERILTTTPLQAQGATLRATIAKNSLTDGEKYAWSARSSDYIDVSARTAACYFVVDSTNPGLPALSITSAATPDPLDSHAVSVSSAVGSPITVHLTPPPGEAIAGYQVWWASGAWTASSPPAPVTNYTTTLPPCDGAGQPVRIVCADTTGSADVVVAPPSSQATLWVAAYDRAGNVSLYLPTLSAASGLTVRAANSDLSAGHAWLPLESKASTIDDAAGDVPLTVGSLDGWGGAAGEDPQLKTPALVTLDRLVRGGVGHWTNSSVYDFPGLFGLQVITGQIGRLEPGESAPAGTLPLYACAYGAGNMLSTSVTCEGAASNPTLLGYSWSTASAVPAGFAPVQIFRCRIGVDYFMSTETACEGGVNEGSRGFVARVAATVSAAPVVDTLSSFTVSGRVRPDSTTTQGTQAIVGTTGVTQSAFFLEASGSKWRFCVRAQGPTKATNCVDGAAVDTKHFATVTGSWDAVNRVISLSVLTDQAFSTASTYSPLPADNVASTGVITVGSAVERGMPSDFFGGSIADVAIYPTLLSDRSLRQLPVPTP